MLAAVEFGVRQLAKNGRIPIEPPVAHSPGAEFFDGAHPVLGTWHVPNASFEHRSECFRTTYTSNGVGARDRERERES